MSVLVTGAAGFIGSHVVDRLAADGRDPVALDDLSTGKETNLRPGVAFERADVSDLEALRAVFAKRRFQGVVHEAARINTSLASEDPFTDVRISVIGTLNLISCCLEFGVERLVFASSVAVYGSPGEDRLPVAEDGPLEPVASYGVAKKCAEDYLCWHAANRGLSYAALRYGNVYGPRQPVYGEVGVIAIFTERAARGQDLVLFGDGEQKRDFLYVDDAVEATVRALDSRERLVLNVASGRATSVNEVLAAMRKAAGRELPLERKPLRHGEIGVFYSSIERARARLGWEPRVPLEEGIRRTLRSVTDV